MKTANIVITKIMTVMAIAAMLAGAVTGCGKSAETVATEESAAESSAPTEASTSSEPSEAE